MLMFRAGDEAAARQGFCGLRTTAERERRTNGNKEAGTESKADSKQGGK
jgi:hypothetical protein